MSRTNSTNYTAAGNNFPIASAASDAFHKEDVQTLAAAVEAHDHTSTKGLQIPTAGITNLAVTTAKLAANAVTQIGFASGSTANPTIASNGTYADLADMSVALTTAGGDLLVFFTGTFNEATTAGDGVTVAFSLDGAAEVGLMSAVVASASCQVAVPTVWRFTGVSAAAHTVKTRWQVSGNFANWTAVSTRRQMIVVEVKK